ncbi:O-antigen ligase family protein [Psychromonas sp. RZ22]|uniref:O-antigen ligase family protein n=1 Tax=Psychromonas algarum TaxID=2555643 RepID=UPI00106890EE|nr:O-antigen ligase family protein [Psychromonas sp. RZ22]TEW56164.1 O-antigen ligase family protein [Psychromonas sp. RZ22]
MLINKNHLNASIWAFIAIVALIYNSMFGALAILIFLISGTIFSITNISYTIDICKKNWILFLIPIWGLFSAFWSEIPVAVIRGSVQLILTTIFAVVIASRLNITILLRSVAIAMLLAMSMSLFSERVALNGLTGEYSLIGIFHSKNHLAINTALSIAVALTLTLDKHSNLISRLLGGGLFFISALVLIKAKSIGSLGVVVLSILMTFLIVYYQNIRIPLVIRQQLNWVITVTSILTFLSLARGVFSGTFDNLFYSLGKDPTLTGRTYIWERGLELIEENPLFGVGSQSVFYVGNDVAEDIWEFAHVSSGAGFNFHNMYIDITVELGFIGLSLFMLLIILFFRKIFSLPSIEIGSSYFFAILIFTYLFLQTFLEAIWMEQFSLTHLFLCMAWGYLKEGINNEY